MFQLLRRRHQKYTYIYTQILLLLAHPWSRTWTWLKSTHSSTGSPNFVRFLVLLKNCTKWNKFKLFLCTIIYYWFGTLIWALLASKPCKYHKYIVQEIFKIRINLFQKKFQDNQRILQKYDIKTPHKVRKCEKNRTMWIFFEKIQTSHKVKFAHCETAQSEGYLYGIRWVSPYVF